VSPHIWEASQQSAILVMHFDDVFLKVCKKTLWSTFMIISETYQKKL